MFPRLVHLLVLIGGILCASSAFALNESTHRIVNEQAANKSNLKVILPRDLGLTKGLDEIFKARSVAAWLGEGGRREDEGTFFWGTARYLRHFHDPLQPWDKAGLRLFLIGQYESSIRWMQRTNQNAETRGTGNWSWLDARRLYATALAAANPSERNQAWADTFRALGQAMHLVVDASVPEHARNDPHVLGPLYGNYEYWIEGQHGTPRSEEEKVFVERYLSARTAPDAIILQEPTGDSAAPVPVARLIDTNRYTGADPNVTLAGPIGIAEFANANFFSENTGHANGDYPFPSVERLIPSQQPAPKTGRIRRYYAKGYGDGLAVDPVLAECALDEAAKIQGMTSGDHKCTDENVWAQVAAATLPRAAGYSAALLDYFFRGQLDVRVVGTSVDAGFRPMLQIRNRTPQETMRGTIELYYDTEGGVRQRLVGWPISLDSGAGTELPPIPNPPQDTPPAQPGRYLLVFRGQLGEEPDAIVANWVTVSIGYVRTLWHVGSCVRQPSHWSCDVSTSASSRTVVPSVDEPMEFASGDTVAYRSESVTIGGPLYPTDNPNFSYANYQSFALQYFALYREGGLATLEFTVNVSAFRPCSISWGTLPRGVESFLASTFFDPPEIGEFTGGAMTWTSGVYTFSVASDSVLFVFYPDFSNSQCRFTSIRFIPE